MFEASNNKLYEVGGGFGHRVTRLVFAKSRDGSLLLTRDFRETGVASILVPIPVSSKEVAYYRFQSVGVEP